jgi:hypothetical protein
MKSKKKKNSQSISIIGKEKQDIFGGGEGDAFRSLYQQKRVYSDSKVDDMNDEDHEDLDKLSQLFVEIHKPQ